MKQLRFQLNMKRKNVPVCHVFDVILTSYCLTRIRQASNGSSWLCAEVPHSLLTMCKMSAQKLKLVFFIIKYTNRFLGTNIQSEMSFFFSMVKYLKTTKTTPAHRLTYC